MRLRVNMVSTGRLRRVYVQLNLVNSKSLGLVVLFQIISCSNYRDVDIKVYIH